jgi:hypothetical protein
MRAFLFCLLCCGLATGWADDELDKPVDKGKERDQKLQAVFDQFPFLALETNKAGSPKFQNVELTNPAVIGKSLFYGFRFTVPEREKQEDLTWAFIEPQNLKGWYITPEHGEINGFDYYFYEPRAKFKNLKNLYPLHSKTIVTQFLPGDRLTNGDSYLIWFECTKQKLPRVSVAFTFATLPHQKKKAAAALEKILGLKRVAHQKDEETQ